MEDFALASVSDRIAQLEMKLKACTAREGKRKIENQGFVHLINAITLPMKSHDK